MAGRKSVWRRLADPRDTQAGWIVAAFLLLGEALLCAAIIWRVPCELSGQMRGGEGR